MDIEKCELFRVFSFFSSLNNTKAHIQFNIYIVEHIIYLFLLMVKSQGGVQKRNRIFNRIWFPKKVARVFHQKG